MADPDHPPKSAAESDPQSPTIRQDSEQTDDARRLSSQPVADAPAVAGYQLEKELGRGAYGFVWLAKEVSTGKRVAIKFFSHQSAMDWPLLAREVEKLAALYTSPHIVSLLDVGWDHTPPYFVMEYLENGSLDDLLRRGTLPVEQAVSVIEAIGTALIHAHSRGILHCDIKPENVLLDIDNSPRLADFGQSRVFSDQLPALGTMFYMAPEQADLDGIPNVKWDVYALGALLYRMLVGTPPHYSQRMHQQIQAKNSLKERLAHYREYVESSRRPSRVLRDTGIDRALIEIIAKCLAGDPEQRFATVEAVLDALRLRSRRRSRRPLLIASVLAPLLIVLGLFPVARTAMRSAVNNAEVGLVARALEGDSISATLLAQNLERELQDRKTELQEYASDETLWEAIESEHGKPWEQRTRLRAKLDQWKRDVERQRVRLGRSLDTSWFLTDASGLQIYRNPASRTIDERFNFRDYFHGRGLEYDPTEVPENVSPITEPYVSQSFRSNATNLAMLAISVPVYAADGEQPIGVLARTAHLWELLTEWEENIQGDIRERQDRVISIIDLRDGRVLDHPWMSAENLRGYSTEELDRLALDETQLAEVQSHWDEAETFTDADVTSPLLLKDYRDPIRSVDDQYDGKWLAALARVGETDWVAVVQERRSKTIAPVGEIERRLESYMLLGLCVSGGLILGIWWTMRQAFSTNP